MNNHANIQKRDPKTKLSTIPKQNCPQSQNKIVILSEAKDLLSQAASITVC